MALRSLWFIAYHLLLALLALSLQAGCSSFAPQASAMKFPWSAKNAAQDPSDSLAGQIVKGLNYERSGQYDKAREVYEPLIGKYPQSVEPAHRLAVLADKQKRHEEAQALYTHAIQLRPGDAELFNDLGYSFYLSGQLGKAESALAKALAIEPGNPRFRNNYGMVLGQQGRLDEAFEEFRSVGSEADAHYNMAFIYASQNRADEAIQCFRRALASDPTHSKASKALESFKRYEESGGQMVDDEYTADGRRLVPYIEDDNGNPDVNAMTNFSINHQVDSALPAGTHNISANRTAGQTTRALHHAAQSNGGE